MSLDATGFRRGISQVTMNFSRNQIIGGIIVLVLLWAVILFRVLSSGT